MATSARDELPRLTTAQVAARLGVKQQSVYAYVSRGLLSRERSERNRGSTFDPLEVEALARRRRRAGSSDEHPGAPTGSPLMVLDSALTVIKDDRLFFRGLDAVRLCTETSFESASFLMWTGNLAGGVVFPADRPAVALLAESDRWRGRLALMDRLRLGVAVAGSSNPTRYQMDTDAVVRSAGGLIPVLVAALRTGPTRQLQPGGDDVAASLWSALSTRSPEPADLVVLNAALVLLLDHDLAMSTLAARVAASARAHPYAVVAAGLAALDGTLHGAASRAAVELLCAVLHHGRRPAEAVSHALRGGGPLPGFGHLVYRRRDPRAVVLLELMGHIPVYRAAVAAAGELVDIIGERTGLLANADLALAVLSIGADMADDAGEAIFAISRTAGWIAHALEEYGAPPARLRPSARYTGPAPEVAP